MKNLCIIPARGGSKRIPKKNIKLFCGKPLIAYSIKTALESELFEKVVVSTDDEEIARVSKSYGAEVLKRPKELADDMAHVGAVIEHTIDTLQKNGEYYDFVCMIYATAPFLQKEYIIKGYEVLKDSNACGSFSVTNFEYPIWRSFKITKDNRCEMFWRENFSKRSQDLQEAYHDAGQFSWKKIGCKSDDIAFGKDSIPIVLPRYLVQDIDTLEDFKRAELMYKVVFPDKFDKWNELKKEIEQKKYIHFNERDILFISIGQNIGYEQYGKSEEFLRPVVVIKKYNKNLFLGIPLSSKIKSGYYFHTVYFKNRENCALLLQSRSFDSKRIKYRLATLPHKQFKKLIDKYCEVVTPLSKERGSD